MLKSKEFYELMEQFEKTFTSGRKDKESKDIWQRGHVYQDGHVNNLFQAYLHGYAFGKVVGRE